MNAKRAIRAFTPRIYLLIHAAHLVLSELQPVLEVFLHLKGVALVIIRSQLVVRILGNLLSLAWTCMYSMMHSLFNNKRTDISSSNIHALDYFSLNFSIILSKK